MTPTDELRTKLRRLIDEVIPVGGTDADTRFTNTEIDEILTEAADIFAAASEGWTRKAARAMSERGGLEESQAGDERHKFVGLEAYRDHCLAMAKMYAGKGGRRSRLMALDPPEVYQAGEIA
jgi:hypothetical protein